MSAALAHLDDEQPMTRRHLHLIARDGQIVERAGDYKQRTRNTDRKTQSCRLHADEDVGAPIRRQRLMVEPRFLAEP